MPLETLRKTDLGFCVVVTRIVDNPEQWSWTILRRDPPLGAKIVETGYPSQGAALSAGRLALGKLLGKLSVEETNGLGRAEVGLFIRPAP
jgi:hypothetical protein